MTKWTKEYRAEYMKKYIAKKKEELGYEYNQNKNSKQKEYYKNNKDYYKKLALDYYYSNREMILEQRKEFQLLYIGKKAKILREIERN